MLPDRIVTLPEYPEGFVDSLNESLDAESDDQPEKLGFLLFSENGSVYEGSNENTRHEQDEKESNQPKPPKPLRDDKTVLKIVGLTIISVLALAGALISMLFNQSQMKTTQIENAQSSATGYAGRPIESVYTELTDFARVENGAEIVDEFTSPPPHGWWWSLSRSYVLDASCVLREPSSECWPIKNTASVGILLSKDVSVHSVVVDLTGETSTPYSLAAYSINSDGSTYKLSESFGSTYTNSTSLADVSQVMIKITVEGTACLRSISVMGE